MTRLIFALAWSSIVCWFVCYIYLDFLAKLSVIICPSRELYLRLFQIAFPTWFKEIR